MIMQFGSTKYLVAAFFAVMTSPAFASIQGTYSGNFLTGKQGGAAYSYVHTSTSAKKSGQALYSQYAGGQVIFAIDAQSDSKIGFNVIDNDTNGSLSAGDTIDLDFVINLYEFDGNFNTPNDVAGGVVATLTLDGVLTVGGTATPDHSAGFSNGIRNITASNTSSSFSGLEYTIEVTQAFSTFAMGDMFSGDAFFQSGQLAGPFNGVSFDDSTDTLSFAIWGDSRNMSSAGVTNNPGTGSFDKVGSDPAIAKQLGFDIFIEAGKVPPPGQEGNIPEATSIIVWSLLSCIGLIALRGRRDASL